MATKKKTAKKISAKPAKAAPTLTRREICDLEYGTELELVIRAKFVDDDGADPDDPSQVCRYEDMDGDTFMVPFGNIISARIMPKAKVKVSGEGAERAAQILRDKGFDVD